MRTEPVLARVDQRLDRALNEAGTTQIGCEHGPQDGSLRPTATIPRAKPASCAIAVLWIDWYAYHVSRLQGLCRHPRLQGLVTGIELVGGTGVHKGLKFREEIPAHLPVTTIFPKGDWDSISKWTMAAALWKQLNRLNPAMVLVPGYYNIPAVTMAVWARLKGRRSVLMTESTESDHQRIWWRELFKTVLIRSLFSWAIAGGKAHRSYLALLGFPLDRIARFYDVVDNNFFWQRAQAERIRHLKAEELGLPEKYFLFVGRLAEEKNVRGLLASYLLYRQQGGTWSLVLVGGGPKSEESALRITAAESPFSADIHFEGMKTSKELGPYYAFAGCFVLPSSREPWGLVVNEAMAAGLPVIVSDACGCAEDLVQHGRNGFLFPASSTLALTGCLTEISRLDAEEWRAMGARSSEIVSAYSPDAWAEEVAQVAGL